jgi:hypothetical protein
VYILLLKDKSNGGELPENLWDHLFINTSNEGLCEGSIRKAGVFQRAED